MVVVAEGRPSLRAVIVASLVLLWIVGVLCAYLAGLRSWHRLRAAWRARRAELFKPAVEMLLMEEPYEKVLAALRPRIAGDHDIVQEVAIDAMRHLSGQPFEDLRRALVELGGVERNLAALRSWSRHRRGHALERLGLMRAKEAVPAILEVMRKEGTDLVIVALRSLAAIGEPSTLPRFLEAAETLPPPLLPRLASLMLEFGPPGRDAALELVNRHPAAFPRAIVLDLLRELAADLERPA